MRSLRKLIYRGLIALAIFTPLLLAILYFTTVASEPYEATERLIRQDAKISATVGTPQEIKFKFWSGFHFTGSDGSFVFELRGSKGNFLIDLDVSKENTIWVIKRSSIASRT
jgi:hypothetical protein